MRWELKEEISEPDNCGWKLHYAWWPVQLATTRTMVWFEWVEILEESKPHYGGTDINYYYRDLQQDSPWYAEKC